MRSLFVLLAGLLLAACSGKTESKSSGSGAAAGSGATGGSGGSGTSLGGSGGEGGDASADAFSADAGDAAALDGGGGSPEDAAPPPGTFQCGDQYCKLFEQVCEQDFNDTSPTPLASGCVTLDPCDSAKACDCIKTLPCYPQSFNRWCADEGGGVIFEGCAF